MKIVKPLSIWVSLFFVTSIFASVVVAFPAAEDEDDDDKPKKEVVHQHTPATLKAALLYDDLVSVGEYNASPVGKVMKRKSPGVAFAMSAVVPGLGQAYNRQWGKAIAAFVVEAAVITGAIVWNNQGQGLESDYQDYAHSFWNPVKYASWLNDYNNYLQVNFPNAVEAPEITIPNQINFRNPDAWSQAEWDVVLDFFSQIQSVERDMFHLETLAAFSHTLPDFSEQQYYELVGKYYQFAPGWEDYPAWRDENGAYTLAIDPSMTGPNDTRPNVSSRFFQYADDHAHANDVLRRASRVTTLLIATHFIAAIEAAVSAKLHNDRITPSLEIGRSERGNPRAMASLRIKL